MKQSQSFPRTVLSSAAALALAAGLWGAAPAQSSDLQDAAGPIDALPAAARLMAADANADGHVSRAEADAFAADYFAVVDADRNGRVSRDEYVEAAIHGVWWRWLNGVASDVRTDFLADGFARHDLDGDGTVNVAEFVARTGTDYASADDDGDGRVSPLEFHLLGLAI